MEYELLFSKDGKEGVWVYNTDTNKFYDNNEAIDITTSIDDSLLDSSFVIRIQLGMRCNYACGYCSENGSKRCNDVKCSDYDKFIDAIYKFIDGRFGIQPRYNFVFWGGEPLLYIDTIKMINESVYKMSGDHAYTIGMITNGQLLSDDNTDWILKNGIIGTISYDGPGQFVRNGYDIFERGTTQHKNAIRLFNSGLWGVSPVMHKYNASIIKYIDDLKSRFDDVPDISSTPFLRVYDNKSSIYKLDATQLNNLVSEYISMGNKHKDIHNKLLRFLASYGKTDRVSTCLPSCTDKYIAVTLDGKLYACHNFINVPAIGDIYSQNYTPHVYKIPDMCSNCLLRHLCRGGCRLSNTADNCDIYWHENIAVFPLLVNLLTQGTLLHIKPKE